MYLGAKRHYINTLPFLSFTCWDLAEWVVGAADSTDASDLSRLLRRQPISVCFIHTTNTATASLQQRVLLFKLIGDKQLVNTCETGLNTGLLLILTVPFLASLQKHFDLPSSKRLRDSDRRGLLLLSRCCYYYTTVYGHYTGQPAVSRHPQLRTG